MSSGRTVEQTEGVDPGSRWMPMLFALFVGSGCAALIYEIVWLQLLEFVVGSSAVSLGILLGTYMGGMCLGSLLLARVVSMRRHPLRVYALLEIGIGVFGIAILLAVPFVSRIYAAEAGRGLSGMLLRGAVCAVCLLPPTLLMGATLPAVSRWVRTTRKGVSWLGAFYGGNIAGGVIGCLLAGFYLLRVHDLAIATFVAAALNVGVAGLAFILSGRTQSASEVTPVETEICQVRRARVYVTIAISGACALGCEVIWTRLLSLLLGATVYTFSIILAVFLVGLGIGSSLGSLIARKSTRPQAALGMCQFLLVFAMGWTAYMLTRSLPYWPINPSLSSNPWLNFQLDLARCLWATLPPALLWGASFPLALAAAVVPGRDPGRIVGKIYAANTAGAIVGAIGTSVILIGWVGMQRTQQVLIALSGVASLVVLLPSLARSPQESSRRMLLFAAITTLLCVSGVTFLVVAKTPKVPWKLIAYGRYLPTYNDDRAVLYVGEGLNASVAVTETQDGIRNFHVSGKTEASSDRYDMRLQRMLGHIPALLHPNPRSVLIVGCGAGVTAGSFTRYPSIERIVICEIEPLIPREVTKLFSMENYKVTQDPRVEIVYDDARHYILTTREKFDIITSDPIHPWVKGAASLYTQEYFQMVRRHLNPGGLVTQWVPLYESNPGVVKSEVATFFSVFPEGTVWSNDHQGQGYDTVLLGGAGPMTIDLDVVQGRLEATPAVARSLNDVEFWSAIGMLATYAGQRSDLADWLRNAEINRDRNLRLQFIAGLAANLYQEGSIYNDMIAYLKFPDTLFTGSVESRQALKDAVQRRK
jgi:spermidine synthase